MGHFEFQNNFDGRIRIIPNSTTLKDYIEKTVEGAKNHEEPFYICNLGEIIRKHIEWRSYMPRVRPFYAVKCNDDIHVLETLAGLGAGFDCASKGEMGRVINLGINPSSIIFANPAKMASHIKASKDFGITKMTFDNEIELHKIKRIYPNAKLVIRIRCDASKAQCQLGMKYGVLPEEAPRLLKIAKELELKVIGISFHVGSGCMEPEVFNRAIASSHWLLEEAKLFGHEIKLLDIGGGFPGNSDSNFSIAEFAIIVNKALDKFFPEGCGVELIAEPGRFFVASAFTLITQVHSLREIKGSNDETTSFMYYINDGVYGSFNCILYDHAEVFPETIKEINKGKVPASIWGPTCDGLDQICVEVLMPRLTIGDWIVFRNMGAYTIVSAGTFNGFPLPKVTYVATSEPAEILLDFIGAENFAPIEFVPTDNQADIGNNRDAVGWVESSRDVMTGMFKQQEVKAMDMPPGLKFDPSREGLREIENIEENSIDSQFLMSVGLFYKYSTPTGIDARF